MQKRPTPWKSHGSWQTCCWLVSCNKGETLESKIVALHAFHLFHQIECCLVWIILHCIMECRYIYIYHLSSTEVFVSAYCYSMDSQRMLLQVSPLAYIYP